jgi:hypothetical protein
MMVKIYVSVQIWNANRLQAYSQILGNIFSICVHPYVCTCMSVNSQVYESYKIISIKSLAASLITLKHLQESSSHNLF